MREKVEETIVVSYVYISNRKRENISRDVSTSRSSTSAHTQELSLRFTQTNATRASTLTKKEIRSIERKKTEKKTIIIFSSLHFYQLATITIATLMYTALEDVVEFCLFYK